MRLLVLGGTSWLGGAVARHALARGHEVTCLARGEAGSVPPGASLVSRDRWQPGAYDGLPEFDAAVEVSWQPVLVRQVLERVQAGHWVYVSSISAYADDDDEVPQVNLGNLRQEWSGEGEATREEYGEAKVACEAAYSRALPAASYLIARAGLIGGYGDRSDRLGYWPARIASATNGRERVLVPSPRDFDVQVIDVLDLAAWLVHCAAEAVSGTYDAVGPESRFPEVLEAARAEAGTSPAFVEATDEQLDAAGVRPWMGPESLPLWIPGSGHSSLDPRPAEEAGMTLRPVRHTVADALRWERELGLDRRRTSGLSADKEAEVLAAL